MKRSTQRMMQLISAVSAVVLPVLTHAQTPVRNDGRALDANLRMGSGGRNDAGRIDSSAASGNQIVTGNVTGGREFRGPVGYRDQREFRGSTAGSSVSDPFVRNSAGVPLRFQPAANTTNTDPRAFYGNARATPIPEGYRPQGFTGGAVAAAPPPQQRSQGDLRVGPIAPDEVSPTQINDLVIPGGTDASGQPQNLTASPLYGIRPAGSPAALRPGEQSRANRPLDDATVQRMRDELRTVAGPGDQTGTEGAAVDQARVNTGVESRAVAPTAEVQASTRHRIVVPPAEAQSEQYAEMLRRLQEQGDKQYKSDEEANRDFQRQLQQLQQMQPAPTEESSEEKQDEQQRQPQGGQPNPLVPDQQQNPATAPAAQDVAPDAVAVKPVEPLVVTSMATGVKAKGLADLLTQAEQAMRDGKFGDALSRYDAAAQVAPNNPLVQLGRAHAELGASYYARAETNLRQAVANDPALLVARYDLKSFFGEERLLFIVRDLKQIAETEQTQSRPVLLLGYIAYNLGNDQQADERLADAQRRAGGSDPVVTLMRQIWRLPGQTPAEELNK